MRPAPTPGPFARDFEAYYAAGATWNAGGDPYTRDIWRIERTITGVDATRDEILPYVGPSAALPLWSVLARLPFDTARVVWETALVVATAGLVLAALALAGARVTSPRTLAALAMAATSGPVLSAIVLGQAALLGAAGTVSSFLALERRSVWAIPAAIVAAIQPNLALPLAVRAFDRRALARLAIAAGVFFTVTLAVGGGVAGVATYFHRLRLHGAAERYITIQHTIPAIAASFGASHARARTLGGTAAVVAVLFAVTTAVRRRTEPVAAACTAVALLPLIVPFFHEHDFAIELFPAIVLLQRSGARLRALTGAAAVMTLVDWFGIAQRPPAAAEIACAALAVAASCALFGARAGDAPADRYAALAPLATVGVLVAACVPLAHAFPAPTWPDALGPYHAPPGAGVAAVWAAESDRSGLAAPVPAWGVLRAIPLVGCVLLAYASARLGVAAQAMKIAPSRICSATLMSDSPMHGPSVQ